MGGARGWFCPNGPQGSPQVPCHDDSAIALPDSPPPYSTPPVSLPGAAPPPPVADVS